MYLVPERLSGVPDEAPPEVDLAALGSDGEPVAAGPVHEVAEVRVQPHVRVPRLDLNAEKIS